MVRQEENGTWFELGDLKTHQKIHHALSDGVEARSSNRPIAGSRSNNDAGLANISSTGISLPVVTVNEDGYPSPCPG